MAPELWRGDTYDESADVYSLGIVLWELPALAHPYEGVPQAHLPLLVAAQGRRPAIPKGAPPAFVAILKACWANEPSERPSASEVLARLQGLRSHELEAADGTPAAG